MYPSIHIAQVPSLAYSVHFKSYGQQTEQGTFRCSRTSLKHLLAKHYSLPCSFFITAVRSNQTKCTHYCFNSRVPSDGYIFTPFEIKIRHAELFNKDDKDKQPFLKNIDCYPISWSSNGTLQCETFIHSDI